MDRIRSILLVVLALVLLTLMVLTWGSVGSAILTLALLLSLGYMLILKIMENRDPDDFRWED